MDYSKLLQEITIDPLSLGYSGKTDDQIVSILNAPNYIAWNDIPVSTPKAYLIGNNLWRSLSESTNANVQQLMDTLNIFDSVQLSNPQYLAWVQATLSDIVASGLLTQTQVNVLLSFGKQQITRAQQIGWSTPPSSNDIFGIRGS